MTDRRSFLKQAAVGGVLYSLLPRPAFAGSSKRSAGGAKRSLRIAHIADVHILDKPIAVTNLSMVLKSINQFKDRPEFIINTGDTVMD